MNNPGTWWGWGHSINHRNSRMVRIASWTRPCSSYQWERFIRNLQQNAKSSSKSRAYLAAIVHQLLREIGVSRIAYITSSISAMWRKIDGGKGYIPLDPSDFRLDLKSEETMKNQSA
jgi:hypothetical protein